MDRRTFLKTSGATMMATQLPRSVQAANQSSPGNIIVPERLQRGDTISFVTPASSIADPLDVQIAKESFEAMGFQIKIGKHALGRWGYLAGTDAQRAEDIHTAFADPDSKAVIALRGGWGCNRILPMLDYDLIASNPKVLLGYSDVTSLLNAVYQKTGLVGYHGPMGISYWGEFQATQMQDLLVNGKPLAMQNQYQPSDALVQRENRIRTITPGVATGPLVGGNLSVLASIVGSPYMPDMRGKILMLEDVEESVYRVDRFLSTLQLAGVLEQINGVVFGYCTDCLPQRGYGSFTLGEVLDHYFKPLNIPAYWGAQFGHIEDNHLLPVGINVQLDASQGTVTSSGSVVV